VEESDKDEIGPEDENEERQEGGLKKKTEKDPLL